MLCPKCGSVVADTAEVCGVCGSKLIYPLLKGGSTRPHMRKARKPKEKIRHPMIRLGVMLPFISYQSKPLLVFLIVVGVYLFFYFLNK